MQNSKSGDGRYRFLRGGRFGDYTGWLTFIPREQRSFDFTENGRGMIDLTVGYR